MSPLPKKLSPYRTLTGVFWEVKFNSSSRLQSNLPEQKRSEGSTVKLPTPFQAVAQYSKKQ